VDEKREAYEALEAAIKRVHELEGWGRGPEGEPMLVTDFVVITAAQGFDAQGDGSFSSVGWILKDGDMPWWKIIGVVRSGLLRMEYQLATMEGS
jgi:hypothetical protein